MSKIDREQLGEWLSAYIDGELDADQRASVERLLREDEAAAQQLRELRRTVNLVSSLPRHTAPSSIAEDLRFHVERAELLDDLEQPGAAIGGRRAPLLAILSTAAVLAAVVGGLWYMAGDRRGTERKSEMLALAPERPVEQAIGEAKDASRIATKSRRGKRSVATRSAKRALALSDSDMRVSPAPAAARRAAEHSTNGLIATASLEQKLVAGMDLSSVRTHPFNNEAVRLKITVRDEKERDRITKRMLARLARGGAVDLAVVTEGDRADAETPRSFYYRGTSHLNFAEGNDNQILVRASRRRIDAVLDEVARAVQDGATVDLIAGPLTIRGLERTRMVLKGLGEPAAATAESEAPRDDRSRVLSQRRGGRKTPPTAQQHAADRDGSLDDLADALGLDPQVFARATKSDSDAELVESAMRTVPYVGRLSDGPPGGPYVTVVVQVLIAKPQQAQPGGPAGPSPKPQRKRAGKTPANHQ